MRMARLSDGRGTRLATGSPRVWCFSASIFILIGSGCAHHRADQYAYAPPYAPPVYSQPHVQMPTQPAAYAAAPTGALPMGAVPAATVVADPAGAQGVVVQAADGACPPCATPGAEGVVMPAAMVEGGGQTPPCPPGP